MTISSLFWLSVQVAAFSLVGAVVFLLLRRRGPSAAAACAATVLMLTLPLLLISLSPWPRWEIAAQPEPSVNHRPLSEFSQQQNTDDLPALDIVDAPAEEIPQESAIAALWRQAGELLQTPKQHVENAPAAEPPAWRAWLPWVMAAGVVVGLARLLIGIWAVRSYRGCSTKVNDSELWQMVQKIARDLNTQPAEVRETSRLRSAATIGWRQPILLLPTDWRTWTETERRVVIAHELAHIARRDYLVVLIARLATAIHFYQPLVLWLSRQLRVQQELAADTVAATITGSRQVYLTTLAQMALRADDQPIPWPARAFLPGTGLLVKRVTWLKRNKSTEEPTMNRRSRWVLAVAMATIALFVAGIRGPNEPASVANAAEPSSGKATEAIERGLEWLSQNPEVAKSNAEAIRLAQAADNQAQDYKLEIAKLRTTEYIPADAKVVIVASPSALAESPSVAKLFQAIGETHFEKALGLNPAQLEDVKLIHINQGGFERVILRSVTPFDWKTLINSFAPDAESRKSDNGKEYFVGKTPRVDSTGHCYFLADSRTIVIATEPEIKKILAGEKPVENTQLESSPLVAQVKTEFLHQWTGAFNQQREAENMLLAAVMPLLDQTELVTVSAAVISNAGLPAGKVPNETISMALSLSCKSEAATKQVAETLSAMRVLSKNYLASVAKLVTLMQAGADQWELNKGEVLATKELLKLGTVLLENTKIDSSANPNAANAVTQAELPKDLVSALILPAIGASREAAMRNQSMNNMKQLALALLNFESARKRFPAAAGARQAGQPKHSWRVAILPYIEEIEMYNNYHFDEPWDSEHNKQFIDKMPAVFRDPHDGNNSTSSSYYMITGKGMFDDPKRNQRVAPQQQGRRFKEIPDGTAMTIMLVDAKRDIPWTKPDDIEIDADLAKPLPKLGGNLKPEGLFLAAHADGSVRAIAPSIDAQTLRKFFTVAGGEPINRDALDPPKPAEPKLGDGGAVQPAVRAAQLVQSRNNMKQIMLGMLNHEDKTRKLPADIHDKNGKPLLSWRVSLLPEVEEAAIYGEFHLDEPWDSAHNIKLLTKMPAVYRNPQQHADNRNSSYFMPIGNGTFGNAGRLGALADGTSKTIALVEAKRDIPWTKPDDIEVDVDPAKPLPKFGGFFDGLFNAGFADGHVSTISATADPAILRGLFTVNGREPVSDEDVVVRDPVRQRPAGKLGIPGRTNTAQSISANNMKQMALAMHNYLSAKKRFPPAAIRDKNGKPLLSWRVAILPYLEEAPVYAEFHLDEPWDSEHNLKLLSKMPKVYQHPMDDPATKNSSYFMVAGKGAFGDSEKGRTPKEIPDGFSNTVMLVEAKRDIPWTKPDEIEFDPDPAKPLPKLGGFFDGAFNFAFADGRVRTTSGTIDEKVMRAMLTVAGGENVSNLLEPPKPVEPKPADNSAIMPARRAAAQTQSINNAKQIMLAMHTYHAHWKKFPPAAMRDVNGKPLLSWRVAILPYIEGADLSNQFHYDEPWDSEHNRKLIDKMPAVFRDPTDDSKSTNASYFMVTGQGMFGDAERGQQMKRIADGLSKTIAIAEAKRDVPWTKPDDIEIDPDPTKPLPKFGGHLQPEGRFVVGYADGRVQVVDADADPDALRKSFTVAGGEIVDPKALGGK